MTRERAFEVAIAVVAGFALLHFAVAGRLGLTVDGAHYALYGRHLALSYFDHPPLVGWMQALILPLSQTDLAMRFWPLVFSLLWPWALYDLCKAIYPQQSSWLATIAIVLATSAIIINLLALAWLPQLPLLLFTLLTARLLIAFHHSNSFFTASLLGLTLGLAGLSEYTAIFLLPMVFYTFFQQANKRRAFAYLSWTALLAALCVSPVFIWNGWHDFASFHYQLHHGFNSVHWRSINFLRSQLIQIAVYGPFITLFGGYLLFRRLMNKQSFAEQLLLSYCIPLLVFFAYSSGYQATLPHWTLTAWVLLTPLCAHAVVNHWATSKPLRHFFRGNLIYCACALLLATLHVFHPLVIIAGKKDPLNDLFGWQQIGPHAAKLLQQFGQSPNDNLFVESWPLASRLAWYSKAPVQVINRADSLSQFDFWYGKPKTGAAGILVALSDWPQPRLIDQRPGHFHFCRLLTSDSITRRHQEIYHVKYFYCHDYQS